VVLLTVRILPPDTFLDHSEMAAGLQTSAPGEGTGSAEKERKLKILGEAENDAAPDPK
jgi:hypothetical protein